jgi:hypothetical protein
VPDPQRLSQKTDPRITLADQNRGVRKVIVLVPLVAALSACGGAKHSAPAPPVRGEWKAVVNDWENNGRLDGRYSCAAVVEAVAHLNEVPTASPTVSIRRIISALDRYAGTVCPKTPQFSKVVVGMSDTDVAREAGMPRTVLPNCWLYPTANTHNGLRVCFAGGRAALVQTSAHG